MTDFELAVLEQQMGSAQPTYIVRPMILVDEDRDDEGVFKAVACAVSALKEISTLRRSIAQRPASLGNGEAAHGGMAARIFVQGCPLPILYDEEKQKLGQVPGLAAARDVWSVRWDFSAHMWRL